MAFLGQFEYSLDAKSRLTIPARFRDDLRAGVVLSKELDGCVAIWPAADWDAHLEKTLGGLDPLGAKARQWERYVLANAFESRVDGAGRVMIPAPLMEHGGLKRDVTVIGVRRRLEVWDRGRWAAQAAELDENPEGIAESLSGSGDTTS